MSVSFSISVAPQLPAMMDPCKTCGVLILRKNMDRHLKVHSGRSISCFICNKNFKTQNSLWQHKKTHDEPENIACNMCSSSFQSKSALRKHVLRIHERKKYSCPYCQKSFADEKYCKNHISTCDLQIKCGIFFHEYYFTTVCYNSLIFSI